MASAISRSSVSTRSMDAWTPAVRRRQWRASSLTWMECRTAHAVGSGTPSARKAARLASSSSRMSAGSQSKRDAESRRMKVPNNGCAVVVTPRANRFIKCHESNFITRLPHSSNRSFRRDLPPPHATAVPVCVQDCGRWLTGFSEPIDKSDRHWPQGI